MKWTPKDGTTLYWRLVNTHVECECGARATTHYGPTPCCGTCRKDFPKHWRSVEAKRHQDRYYLRRANTLRRKGRCRICGKKRGKRSRWHCDPCQDVISNRQNEKRRKKRSEEGLW